MKIVCANCEVQSDYNVSEEGCYSFTCPDCEMEFDATIGTTRSKRSRGHKPSLSREYSIRFFQNELENFLQFESNVYEDVELRSKDIFVISSLDGVPRILANLNIQKYWVINTKRSETNDAAVMTTVLILVFAGLIIAALISSS